MNNTKLLCPASGGCFLVYTGNPPSARALVSRIHTVLKDRYHFWTLHMLNAMAPALGRKCFQNSAFCLTSDKRQTEENRPETTRSQEAASTHHPKKSWEHTVPLEVQQLLQHWRQWGLNHYFSNTSILCFFFYSLRRTSITIHKSTPKTQLQVKSLQIEIRSGCFHFNFTFHCNSCLKTQKAGLPLFCNNKSRILFPALFQVIVYCSC